VRWRTERAEAKWIILLLAWAAFGATLILENKMEEEILQWSFKLLLVMTMLVIPGIFALWLAPKISHYNKITKRFIDYYDHEPNDRVLSNVCAKRRPYCATASCASHPRHYHASSNVFSTGNSGMNSTWRWMRKATH
jgi:hypothetical protein